MVIREARESDAPAIGRVHVDTWRSAYRGIVPDEHLDGLSYERVEERIRGRITDPAVQSFLYVAEMGDGRAAGFAWAGRHRDETQRFSGEIYAIYVLDRYQRMGVGRQLVRAVAERLLSMGLTSMLIWVLKENPARRFYDSLGGHPVGEQVITIGGREIVEVGYGWDDLSVLL